MYKQIIPIRSINFNYNIIVYFPFNNGKVYFPF